MNEATVHSPTSPFRQLSFKHATKNQAPSPSENMKQRSHRTLVTWSHTGFFSHRTDGCPQKTQLRLWPDPSTVEAESKKSDQPEDVDTGATVAVDLVWWIYTLSRNHDLFIQIGSGNLVVIVFHVELSAFNFCCLHSFLTSWQHAVMQYVEKPLRWLLPNVDGWSILCECSPFRCKTLSQPHWHPVIVPHGLYIYVCVKQNPYNKLYRYTYIYISFFNIWRIISYIIYHNWLPGSSDTGRLIRFSTGNLVVKKCKVQEVGDAGMLQLEEKNQNVAFKKIKSDSSSVSCFFCRDLSWPLKKNHSIKKRIPDFFSSSVWLSIEFFALKIPWHLHLPPSLPLYWGTTCRRSQGWVISTRVESTQHGIEDSMDSWRDVATKKTMLIEILYWRRMRRWGWQI